jgi:hypothetical protein
MQEDKWCTSIYKCDLKRHASLANASNYPNMVLTRSLKLQTESDLAFCIQSNCNQVHPTQFNWTAKTIWVHRFFCKQIKEIWGDWIYVVLGWSRFASCTAAGLQESHRSQVAPGHSSGVKQQQQLRLGASGSAPPLSSTASRQRLGPPPSPPGT